MTRARTRRKRLKQAPAPFGREVAAVCLIVGLFAGIAAWKLWPERIKNPPRPVTAHSTPRVEGACAVRLSDGAVWGRIIRVGTARGVMDRYLVQTLTEPVRMTEVSVTEVRKVPCAQVTGKLPS